MFKSYVTIAFRNLFRHKVNTLINITGLVIGLMALILTRTLIDYEESHDTFFPDAERIYAIYATFQPDAGIGIKHTDGIQTAVQPLLADNIPGIEISARLVSDERVARYGDRLFYQNIRFADPDFLKIFTLEFIEGDASALADQRTIILSQSTAIKYFGDEDPIGKVLTIDNQVDLQVSAVFADLPVNSHFTSNMVLDAKLEAISTLDVYEEFVGAEGVTNWYNMSADSLTYVKLGTGVTEDAVIADLGRLYDEHAPENVTDLVRSYGLRPLPDLYLFIWTATELPVPQSIRIIGVLILVVAVMNYTNLTNAQYMGRVREIGLRKSLGAGQRQLLAQFLTESIALTLASLVIAVAAAQLILPMVNQLSGKAVTLGLLSSPTAILELLAIAVGTGLIAGFYPAYKISRTPITDCLGESGRHTGGKSRIRNLMVAVQYAVAILLAAGATVIYAQNLHMENSGSQFDRHHIVTLDRVDRTEVAARYDSLKNELLAIPGVMSMTASNNVPFEQSNSSTKYAIIRGIPEDAVMLNRIFTDFDFLETYDIPLLAGRDFSKAYDADIYHEAVDDEPRQDIVNVMINEFAVRALGWSSSEEALGQSFFYAELDDLIMAHKVIGILPDMNYQGFHNEIKPTVYAVRPAAVQTAAIKVSGTNLPATLEAIDETWARINPDYPIVRRFLDDYFNDVFFLMSGMGMTLAGFAMVAVFVAAIGLYGLASFMAEKRTKEIGIRKVFGASSLSLIRLMVWQISMPVLIAIALAAPLSWFAVESYLGFFADRITLTPALFLVAGAGVLGIAWGIVSLHAWRVANENPIQALRYE